MRLLSEPRYADYVRVLDQRVPKEWSEITIRFPLFPSFHVPLSAQP